MKIIYERKTEDFYYWNNSGDYTPLCCPAHMHYHVEIVYTKRGETKAYVDSDEYTLRSGDLLVVFPNQIHRFDVITQQTEYDLFIINPDLASEITPQIAGREPECAVIRDAKKNQRIIKLIEILSDAAHFPPSSREPLMRGYMLSFFCEMLEMLTLKSVRSDESRAMRAIVKFCSKNFKNDISLSVLEEKLHLSKYYISHLFGDKLGISFTDYLNSLRIAEACRLLRLGDESVTEIAYAVGFGTLRTFNRAFIKQLGCSPSEYRRENRNDAIGASMPTENIRYEYEV